MIKAEIDNEKSSSYNKKYENTAEVSRLAGKHIIICNAKTTGEILFYQDKTRKADGFWSEKMADAYAFPSKIMADAYCKRMRFNKPCVKYVNPETYELE